MGRDARGGAVMRAFYLLFMFAAPVVLAVAIAIRLA